MCKYKIALKFLNACSQFLYLSRCGLVTHFADWQQDTDHPLRSTGLNGTDIYYLT